MSLPARIATIGEIVWDIFPDRTVLGGAPLNVAFHLNRFHLDTICISRVGKDPLGDATRKEVRERGLSAGPIQSDPSLPTGTVTVTIGEDHQPAFAVTAPAAWDAIDPDEALDAIGDQPFALVCGTLAQRAATSRKTVHLLMEKAQHVFYDVNLRPPFTTRERVEHSLSRADTVKVNEGELATLGRWFGLPPGAGKDTGEALLKKFSLHALAVTCGNRGAWLLSGGRHVTQPGICIEVQDTVGAGDAFYAALIEGYVSGRGPVETLIRANRMGALVAAHAGATPDVTLDG